MQQIYFKYCSTFDSTPKGNIGPVVDALMELMEEPYTVLAPAMTANGRTVKDGILYVNGIPLAESSMKDHPLNPMRKSNIAELMMEQSKYPCFITEYPIAADTLQNSATTHFTIVPDYQTEEDGAKIAQKYGKLRFLTGGSGLLWHLGRLYKNHMCKMPLPPCPQNRQRLILVGSCSAATQRQVHRYLEEGGFAVRIEPDKIASGMQTEAGLKQAISSAPGDILLYSTVDPGTINKKGSVKTSQYLEALFGQLALHGYQHGFRRIVVAGGETSGAVSKALNEAAYLIGESIAPGVPELWTLGEKRLYMALKSGNFGDEDFFLNALEAD